MDFNTTHIFNISKMHPQINLLFIINIILFGFLLYKTIRHLCGCYYEIVQK